MNNLLYINIHTQVFGPTKTCQTLFLSGCITFIPTRKSMKVSVTQHPAFHIVGLSFLSHYDRRVVVPHCSFNFYFSIGYDTEHHLMCLFAMCISSLMKYLFKSFIHFNALRIEFWKFWEYLFWVFVLHQMGILPIFSLVYGLSFHSLLNVTSRAEVLSFNEI